MDGGSKGNSVLWHRFGFPSTLWSPPHPVASACFWCAPGWPAWGLGPPLLGAILPFAHCPFDVRSLAAAADNIQNGPLGDTVALGVGSSATTVPGTPCGSGNQHAAGVASIAPGGVLHLPPAQLYAAQRMVEPHLVQQPCWTYGPPTLYTITQIQIDLSSNTFNCVHPQPSAPLQLPTHPLAVNPTTHCIICAMCSVLLEKQA